MSPMKYVHPSPEVRDGKLRGTTDNSGHHHFLCPRCADNTLMQIVDYLINRNGPVEYSKENRRHVKRDFKITFKLHCLTCRLDDFVEISNDGWQGGKLEPGFFFSGEPIYPVSN